jgi:hypothetical protein
LWLIPMLNFLDGHSTPSNSMGDGAPKMSQNKRALMSSITGPISIIEAYASQCFNFALVPVP